MARPGAGVPHPAGDAAAPHVRDRLQAASFRISINDRGPFMENIFIERLWRSIKYEAIYLHAIADCFTARHLIRDWVAFPNAERPHAALGGRTPAEGISRRPACGYDG